MTGAGAPADAPAGAFGAGAARLAGYCGVVLGWTPDAFWRATPAELGALVTALAPPAERPVDAALLARLRERLDG